MAVLGPDVPSTTDTLLYMTTNGTSTEAEIPQYVGFIACAVTTILFATNFIPVKKFETGDGLFFQWVFCMAIAFSGVVIQCIRQSDFYPFAMVGGLMWATGNLCVVPIVKTVGLGLGLCLWACAQLVVGWANGRFGLIGIDAEVPPNITLNYVGVALSLFSAVLYALVKPEIVPISQELEVPPPIDSPISMPSDKISGLSIEKVTAKEVAAAAYVETLSPAKKKAVGISLAMISGSLYAIQFVPSIYIQEHVDGASQNALDFVFAHFMGIFMSSTVYFTIYIIYRKNSPLVYPRVILPAFVSGIMWGIASASWFIANKALSEPVSFPIVSTVPMGISLVIGIVIFKEIKGRRNIIIILVAVAFTMTGAIIAGLSKADL